MNRTRLTFWVFVVGVAASVGQILMLGPLLPERVASHFGPSGDADGFLSRDNFLLLQWGLTGFIGAFFVGLPWLLRITPPDAINLPNKDYWLAPERRVATLAFLDDRFFALGAATLALMAAVMQQIYIANLGGSVSLGNIFWVYIAAYLIYTVVWTLTLTRRFSPPRS